MCRRRWRLDPQLRIRIQPHDYCLAAGRCETRTPTVVIGSRCLGDDGLDIRRAGVHHVVYSASVSLHAAHWASRSNAARFGGEALIFCGPLACRELLPPPGEQLVLRQLSHLARECTLLRQRFPATAAAAATPTTSAARAATEPEIHGCWRLRCVSSEIPPAPAAHLHCAATASSRASHARSRNTTSALSNQIDWIQRRFTVSGYARRMCIHLHGVHSVKLYIHRQLLPQKLVMRHRPALTLGN